MSFRFVLIFLTCLIAASCQSSGGITLSHKLSEQQTQEKAADTGRNSNQPKDSKKDSNNTNSITQQSNDGTQNKRYKAYNPAVTSVRTNHMTLVQTGMTNELGNPLYELRLYAKGQLKGRYITVTGRAYSQDRDRHESGTKAPLPNGKYSVAKGTIPGSHPEVGDRFLPIEPLFSTNRRYLGIHYDPSFEIDNGEDGTSGCIALTNRKQLSQVLKFVQAYQPQFIEVSI